MRAVVQRVSSASVIINNATVAKIEKGYMILLGVEHADSNEDAQYLADKIARMRIFSDLQGKMNLDISQVSGSIIVVSQFTLHAHTAKGNRPSFIQAAPPTQAIPLYQAFVQLLSKHNIPVQTGQFGADMQLNIVNNGPVTIVIDSKNK